MKTQSELNVVTYIKENSLQKLKEEFGIKVSTDDVIAPNLMCLNYDHIASPKSHVITQECRGLILDKNTLEVVSRSFDRFYNYGEVPEQTKQVDFSNALVVDKLDGSLVNWYYSPEFGRWEFATRGSTTARNAITKSRISYHHLMCEALGINVSDMNPLVSEEVNWLDVDLYNEYLNRINAVLDNSLVKGNSYITELVSPLINIVTKYTKTNVYHLATRNIYTGAYSDDVSVFSGFKSPDLYSASSLEDVMDIITSLSKGDMLREGVVVCDKKTGIRTKIKNKTYLKVHRNLGKELDTKSILELVADNEEAEYLTYYPEDAHLFTSAIASRQSVFNTLQVLLDKANTCLAAGDTVNEIAKWLKNEKYSEFVFPALKKGFTTGESVYSSASLNARVKAIKTLL